MFINLIGANNLTEDEAKLRSSLVSNVSYNLFVDIVGGSPQYTGQVVIKFDYKVKIDVESCDFD